MRVWSNGDPITAQDFVYSVRRGVSPALASQNAYLAYYINYAQAYNRRLSSREIQRQTSLSWKRMLPTVRLFGSEAGPTARSLLSMPPAHGPEVTSGSGCKSSSGPRHSLSSVYAFSSEAYSAGRRSARNKLLAKNAKLQAAVQGKEFVP